MPSSSGSSHLRIETRSPTFQADSLLSGFPGGSAWRLSLPAVQETQVQSLGQEDPLENGMATHSSILAGEFHGQRSLWWAIVHEVAKSQILLSN